jgi:tetratricopeptide (TPR) repeat protein
LARSRSSSKAPILASKWRVRTVLLLIALAAYVNSFGLGLAQDSTVLLKDARLNLTGDTFKLILDKNYWWQTAGDGLYRPVTTLSFAFNHWFLGNGPGAPAYHVTNFLLHAINVCLLYELALLIFRRDGPAFFASALWAVHPICTESVTSIAGRADLLAALSVLGGLLVYVRGRSRWAPGALFAIATMGAFAKENAAVLLGLMLLWDVSFREKPRWRCYAVVAASLTILAVVRHTVLSNLPAVQPPYADNPLIAADFWTARWAAIKVIGLNLWLLLCPIALSSDHPQLPLATWSDTRAWVSLLAVAAILAIVIVRRRKDPVLFWAAGFFAISLLPTSNLVILIGAAMAERFLYLPAVGFAMAVTALLYRLKTERYGKIALIALLVLYTARTLARNPDWNDDLSLASADVPHAPNSFRLHDMLAKALFDQDARGNIDRVIAEQEASWTTIAHLPPAHSSSIPPTLLGQYYVDKADFVDPPERRVWYEKSLRTLLKAREISRAIEEMYDSVQQAHGRLMVRAANPALFLSLGNTYMNLSDFPDAIDALRFAKGINPHTIEVYDGLAIAYTTMGDFPKAVVTMEEKALVDNFQPATMAALRDLYQKTPDGQCAFVQRAAGWEFNLAGCPRVKGDVCAAFADLAQAYRDSRSPQDAEQLAAAATQRYACPAP